MDIFHKPDKLYIETTNLCNARCVFCMYPKIHGTFPVQYMDQSLFESVINDYIGMGGRKISMTPTIADPFTDRYFPERIKFLEKSAIKQVDLVSNFIAFRTPIQEAFENLENITLDIHISMIGWNKKMYHELMGVDKFDKVIENLNILGKILNKKKNIKATLVLREYDNSPLNQDLKTMTDICNKNNIGTVTCHGFDTWGGLLEEELKNNKYIAGQIKQRKPRTKPCEVTYRKPLITTDGLYKVCECRDVNFETVIGDVKEKPFSELWHSEELKRFRNLFYTPDKLPEVCKKCEVYTPYEKVSYL